MLTREVDDRGFDADGRGSRVENQIDRVAERFLDVFAGRRRELHRAIRARRRDGNARGLEQGPRDRVRGNAHGHSGQARRHGIRHLVAFGEHDRERPGPKGPRQPVGSLIPAACHVGHVVDTGDVHDERIVMRTTLRDVDALDGERVERVRAEPVDGLRRKRDELAGAKERGRFGDRGGVRMGGIDLDDAHAYPKYDRTVSFRPGPTGHEARSCPNIYRTLRPARQRARGGSYALDD